MTIIRLPEVKNRTGLSKTTIYAMIAGGAFPKPIKLSVRAVGWQADIVEGWVKSKVQAMSGGVQ